MEGYRKSTNIHEKKIKEEPELPIILCIFPSTDIYNILFLFCY